MSEGRSMPGFTDSYTFVFSNNCSNKMLKLISLRELVQLSVLHRIGDQPVTDNPHSYY